MSSLYTEIIQDAYRHPRHRGAVARPTHSHEDENPLCGDTLRIQLRVENGSIAEARFDGRGCAISQAAAELLLDRIEHQPADLVHRLTRDDVLEELGIPSISPARLKCALLSLEVLRRALPDPV
ncbi:MAG TPA: iron-sulfur cluster assembly scaffold protein [Chloroflexota bacterium]|nr:iron-sulfur cluster assembly scaffold protein [Chloroflexota bacterium]